MKYTLFSASWCGYCQPVKQLIERNELPVEIVDIDEQFDKAAEAGVKGIPAIQLEDGTLMRESQDIIKMLKDEFKCQ